MLVGCFSYHCVIIVVRLQQMTLLHWACDRGNVKMVQLLIDYHVPINEQVSFLLLV